MAKKNKVEKRGTHLPEVGKATRFQKGHKGFGGGTTPKVMQMHAREFILQCVNGEDGIRKIIMAAYARAIKGSIKHQELILNYVLGRPVENIKIDQFYGAGASRVGAPIIKIIADNIRLNKLAADVDASPVITEERIMEMEKILNKEIDGEAKE